MKLRRGLAGLALGVASLGVWGAGGDAGALCGDEGRADTLVSAYHDGGLSGGNSWSLLLAPDGAAYVHLIANGSPHGQIQGRYFLHPDELAAIEQRAREHGFEALTDMTGAPQAQGTTGLHVLTMQAGGKRKTVKVTGQVPPSPELRRFWAVWDAVWATVPLRPARPGMP
ncbi:MAG: hypothetical protein Q4G71_08725 [Pseudomonadota bacterium]|nr:hypothetical protein [Pseudomonadota bacterium]